jgi:hypothetical protein
VLIESQGVYTNKGARMSRFCVCLILALAVTMPWSAYGEATSDPPVGDLRASDHPSDDGTGVTLEWSGEGEQVLTILRSMEPLGGFDQVGQAVVSDGSYTDRSVARGIAYYYKLAYVTDSDSVVTEAAGPAIARSDWFRDHRLNTLATTVTMFALVIGFVTVARQGRELYIRKIPGLNAINEAVGRATEMGKKIMYIPGILSLSEIQTIASLSILEHIAKLTAVYGTDIEVPNKDPLVFSAARETVKQAYLEAGKPDQFKEEMVTYITYDQFAYAASITAKMVREKPATNFLIGSFFAESLILAETGQAAGAIQVAGTADIPQLPFFVTTCDYTLLGEELYAASAYLSREPVLLGSIKAQDIAKVILMVVMGVGIVLATFGNEYIKTILITR